MIPFKFSGEGDRGQIGRGVEKAKAENAEVVVGLGGGKAIDLAKAVAMEIDAKLVTAPTIASNDAPTSAATVYYTEEGNFDGWGIWPRNPDLVLVDTQVIVEAPVRWLISGIGDGLATWFEAEAAYKGRRVALAGGVATQLCLDGDIDPDERLAVFDFMVEVGLPVTLEDLGLGGISSDALKSLAEALCGPDQITHNHVFTVTPFDMYSAIVAADKLGRSCKALAE